MKIKILTIVGARPQFIKAAALSREFAKNQDLINEIIVHTGQHFDHNMSEVFFQEMNIPVPDYNLGIASMGHGAMTGRMLESIEKVILKENPDYLLVYGDTNSTFAGALAAKKMHVPVIHIEAGLRSFNMKMPEEINRILTDRISDVLFCPTDTAIKNLHNEGYQNIGAKVYQVGDVMEDAVHYYKTYAEGTSNVLKNNDLTPNNYLLATVHRAENTDATNRLTEIVNALNDLHQNADVVVPLHPRTKQKIKSLGIDVRFKLLDPVGYFDMLKLVSNSRLILTDSGGLQKEAFINNKYCITMRDETEWVELVEGGYNTLVGASRTNIIRAVNHMIDRSFNKLSELYGGGKASEAIVDHIISDYEERHPSSPIRSN